jgi:hypothetical protein
MKEDLYDLSQPVRCSNCDAVLYVADPKQIKTDEEGYPLCDRCHELKDDPNRDDMLLGG